MEIRTSANNQIPKTNTVQKTCSVSYCRNTASDIIDIKANGKYPANILSNFAKTSFEIDGVKIASIEGFLQSLKTNDPELQKKICQMNGYEAKNFAKRFTREPSEVLCFWQGQSFKKSSPEFKKLIKQILEAKSKTYDGKIFKFAGYDISSVNSFILALKSDNPEFQKQLMLVSEDKVKEISKNIKPRYCPRTLYWNGKTFTRDSEEYKKLLEEVYKTRYKHDYSFRQALRFAKKYTLEHSIGKNDIGDTVLTKNEFINILKKLQKNDKLKYKCFDYFKQILKCIFR